MTTKAVTPVRAALVPASTLHPHVKDGLTAVKAAHKAQCEDAIRAHFVDSIDLDEAMREGREGENRWDYLLGHGPSACVIGLEPHSAKSDEVDTVIRKRRAALDQLRSHLKPAAKIVAWLWVASGDVHFADTERARRRLDQNGIQFVGRRLRAKHLSALASPPTGKA